MLAFGKVCDFEGDDESNGCRWPILQAIPNDPQLPHVFPKYG
jgi:hypothetical protein